MKIKVRNPIDDCEELSAISTPVNAGDTAITVLNNEGFATDDYIVIGEIGQEQTELRKVSSVSGAGTINLTSSLSFSHPNGISISVIQYNQYEVSRKTSDSGAFSVLATDDLEVDDIFSVYVDTGGQAGYSYRFRFKNETTGQFSSYSATIKGSGYSTRAAKPMVDTVLSRTNDDAAKFTSRKQVLRDLNYGYQRVIKALHAASSEYYQVSLEIPTESFKHEYSLPDNFGEIVDITDGERTIINPTPQNDVYYSRGYELIGRNTLYLEDVPDPTATSVTPTEVFKNNAFDEDGTWTAGDDTTNVTTDTDEFKTGTGSINFDIDVSQDADNKASLVNSTFAAQDLSDYDDSGKWRVWFYLPDVTYISGITMYWGSDSSNYWSLNATKDYKDHAFHDGWNLLEFDWNDATETLSPSAAAIDYLNFDINYSSSQPDDTDFRLDGIRIANRWEGNHVYEVTYLKVPDQLTNEMDELEIPEGYQDLILDYAVAQILMRQGERDTLAQKLLNNFEQRLSKFISQSAKRTRRMIGFRGRKRTYRLVGDDSTRVTHSDGNQTVL